MSSGKNRFIIKNTRKYGKGVFASENIGKGDVIHILSGERLDIKDVVKRVLAGGELIDDPLQIGRRTYLDLDQLSRTFNHSCDPNAGVRGVSELFALREIGRGEEITYDYSLTITPTQWAMKCQCGSSKCRQVIGDILSVPPQRREEYRKLGALQTYQRRLLKEIDEGRYQIPQY